MAKRTKELTEDAITGDGVLTDEGKQYQKSRLIHLKSSEEAVESTNRMILDAENSGNLVNGTKSRGNLLQRAM